MIGKRTKANTVTVPYNLLAISHEADTTIKRGRWRIGIDMLHNLFHTTNDRIVRLPLTDRYFILVAAPDLDIAKFLLHRIAGNGEIGIRRHNMADRGRNHLYIVYRTP